jgi:hypothetical protein
MNFFIEGDKRSVILVAYELSLGPQVEKYGRDIGHTISTRHGPSTSAGSGELGQLETKYTGAVLPSEC